MNISQKMTYSKSVCHASFKHESGVKRRYTFSYMNIAWSKIKIAYKIAYFNKNIHIPFNIFRSKINAYL